VKDQNEKKPEKKGAGWKMTWTFFVYAAALLCFVGAGVFFGISAAMSEEKDFSPVLQCAAGVLLLHLPFIFERLLKIAIPKFMKAVFYVFLVGSILCGTVLTFFYTVPHWDDIMHFISGTLAGLFGYVLLKHVFRGREEVLSPLFAAFFAVCFAMLVGSVWEIYEYAADGLAGLNMQRFMTREGVALVGRGALYDTMKDIIVDFCGALLSGVLTFFHRKKAK
jgi:hypothetical protein